MKKFLRLVLALTVICLAVAGCANSFDWERNVAKLEAQGLTVERNYAEGELEDATALANSEICFMGGDFQVEVMRYTSMIQKGDFSHNCQFFEFATEEQAMKYAELYLSARQKDSQWKVAQRDCVVVVTNLAIAQELTGLKFQ